MLHRKFPSLVPSLSGMVPASKSATMRWAYMVSYECHRPVLRRHRTTRTTSNHWSARCEDRLDGMKTKSEERSGSCCTSNKENRTDSRICASKTASAGCDKPSQECPQQPQQNVEPRSSGAPTQNTSHDLHRYKSSIVLCISTTVNPASPTIAPPFVSQPKYEAENNRSSQPNLYIRTAQRTTTKIRVRIGIFDDYTQP